MLKLYKVSFFGGVFDAGRSCDLHHVWPKKPNRIKPSIELLWAY